jgi:ADP-ribosyl-[dinitrogen reductase] hydrolase
VSAPFSADAPARTPRTSVTDPLLIAQVTAPGGGTIGLTLCPGKHQRRAWEGDWERDLDTDIATIKAWGATTVVTLMEARELDRYEVSGIREAVEAAGMKWMHLPIVDGRAPGRFFERLWVTAGVELRDTLAQGGLGRAGTVTTRLLIEMGADPVTALDEVRAARPGAVQSVEQEMHLEDIAMQVAARGRTTTGD